MPDLSALDWSALARLRALFLARDAAASGPYWQDGATLAAYDATYAERIGWKWDALLRELRLRHWSPPGDTVLLDFGCGSGVASRRVLAAFGPQRFRALALHDHSPEAIAFASARARTAFPDLPQIAASLDPSAPLPYTLVVSHVLNELAPSASDQLVALAARAACILWVEPGTHSDSRALAKVRNLLLPHHSIVAPCTHRETCPLFSQTHERDWCHFFAEPPTGVQNSADWVRFAQRAGIDLRSQAYSCLVLQAHPEASLAPASAGRYHPPAAHPARMLGRPEVFKPYARFLACGSDGLHWLELSKRVAPALVKRLGKAAPVALYDLRHDGKNISLATPLLEDTTADKPDTDSVPTSTNPTNGLPDLQELPPH